MCSCIDHTLRSYCWWFGNPAFTSWGKGSLSTTGFVDPRWCRISSINSIGSKFRKRFFLFASQNPHTNGRVKTIGHTSSLHFDDVARDPRKLRSHVIHSNILPPHPPPRTIDTSPKKETILKGNFHLNQPSCLRGQPLVFGGLYPMFQAMVDVWFQIDLWSGPLLYHLLYVVVLSYYVLWTCKRSWHFTTKDSAGNRLQNLMQSKVIKDAKKRIRHRDDRLDPFAQGTHGATYSRIKDVVLYLLLLH